MNFLGIGLLLFQVQLGNAGGIVTKPGGAEPVPGATVILNPVVSTQTSRIRSTISEDDGRFIIRDIEPGDYRLEVQSPFYGSAAYGQRKPDGPGAILTIAAGQQLADLKVSMASTGAIAGRITGRSGEPLAYASVQALRYLYQQGKRVLAVVQATTTDDRGEYRLFWLPSGKYVVVAGARSSLNSSSPTAPRRPGQTILSSDLLLTGIPFLNQPTGALLEGTNLVTRILEDGTVQEESWTPVYYPSMTDSAQATAVDVSAGATAAGIDILLGPSRVQKIRGRVTGVSPTGQATVTLIPVGQGTSGRIIGKGASMIDGAFEFAGVTPGPYYLTAQDRTGLVSRPVAVIVGDRDAENITISLAPAVTVTARITVEGMTPGSVDPSIGLVGILRPDLENLQEGIRMNFGPRNSLLAAGNVFAFPNVPPGNYQFSISQAAVVRQNEKTGLSGPTFHIKSVRLGREDVLDTIHLTSDTANALLEVVLTTDTGLVEGVALDRTGVPAANATVVLIPTNARRRAALYKTLITGNDGKFRFQEIPPGDYKLFAWDDIETGAWQDIDFMRPFEPRGRAIRVSENSKEAVDLNVIYNP